jgi:hypothetical protein
MITPLQHNTHTHTHTYTHILHTSHVVVISACVTVQWFIVSAVFRLFFCCFHQFTYILNFHRAVNVKSAFSLFGDKNNFFHREHIPR